MLEANGRSTQEAIVIDSDDEEVQSQYDRDMLAAIEASKAEASANVNIGLSVNSTESTTPTLTPAPTTPLPTTTPLLSSFMSERAALEEARLQRQKRRQDQMNENKDSAPRKKQRVSPSLSEDSETVQVSTSTAFSSSSKLASKSSEPLFWQGIIRQIANAHVDPRKDTKPTFRLSEIITSVRVALCL